MTEIETRAEVKAYKAFNKDWTCNGFQYEVGGEYTHKGKIEPCQSGFHACENPLDVLNYYDLIGSKFAEVVLSGKIKKHEDKHCASKITILREINIYEYINTAVDQVINGIDIKKIQAVAKGTDLSSSGNSARIGSSGDYARIGSSGNSAQIGSSGYSARIGSSGNSARIGSSGDYAQIGSSGNSARIGSSGYSAQIGSSGDYARIGSSGYSAQIGSSGYSAQIGSSGYSARIGSSGDYAQIGSSGYSARIGSSGNSARIGSSGDYARIGSSGYSAQIGSSGYSAQIGITGEHSVGAGVGRYSKIKGIEGTPIALCHYDVEGHPVKFVCGVIGKKGLKADVWYTLDASGKFVEVQE